jgi:hypothetical protein
VKNVANIRLVQEAVLDEVTAENITELLDSHGQQLFNGDLEKESKELSQQKEEKKRNEEPSLKCTKPSSQ